ncbi:MAG: PAS domain-containing protein, partial [Solirubrobacteraceae bacterium]|nr:PAS domain-containing protein [Solirubrobacteraceae bacterium]
DEILGFDDRALFPADQARDLMGNDARVMREGQVRTYEEALSTRDGPVTYLATKGPLRNEHGEVVGMFGISRDITDRKRVEQSLRDATDLVQAVGDSVLDHVAVLGADGRIIRVNAAWRRFAADNAGAASLFEERLGIGADYLANCGSSVDADGVRIAEQIGRVLAGERARYTIEYACHGPGVERWFQMNVTPLRTAAGGAVVVHTEVSERRRAEAALRASEQRFRRSFRESPLPQALLADDGTLIDLNSRFVQLLGYTAEDLPTLAHWWPLAYPDATHRATAQAAWNRSMVGVAAEGLEFEAAEYEVTCRDGTVRTLVISAISIGRELLATFVDVTHRKHAEQAARES